MLLKVLVYVETNTYSSRKLAEACRERVPFMWLSSMSKADHNTINRFRRVRLRDTLRRVFEEVVKYLAAEGLLSIEEVIPMGLRSRRMPISTPLFGKRPLRQTKKR